MMFGKGFEKRRNRLGGRLGEERREEREGV